MECLGEINKEKNVEGIKRRGNQLPGGRRQEIVISSLAPLLYSLMVAATSGWSRAVTDRWMDGWIVEWMWRQTYGRTDRRAYRRNIQNPPVFYGTFSPSGAAAQ